jgi:hypothetical protein
MPPENAEPTSIPHTIESAAQVPVAAVAAPAAPPAEQEFKVTLDRFCVRLSGTSKQVELIAAFAHVERAAGRNHDFPSAYHSRFATFGSRPTT